MVASWPAAFTCMFLLYTATALRPAQHHEAALRGGLPPGNTGDCTPLQVHVGLGKTPQEMHVSWKTLGSSCPSQLMIKPGQHPSGTLQSDEDANLVYGYNFLLSEHDMCSEPASVNVFSLQLHRVHLGDLEPGAWYLYQVVGSDQVDVMRAAPLSSPEYKTTFVAYGDMGDPVHAAAKSPGAGATIRTLEKELDNDVDVVLHVGDISYANGDPDIWDSFMDAITPLTRRMPYMVAVGNHEYSWYDLKHGDGTNDPSGAKPYNPGWGNYGPDARGECGVMAARRFYMPRRRASDNPPFWYGFDYGSVHFTVLSTEHDVTHGSPQHDWLQHELAAVDRCATPWLVVLLHRPMYVVYPHKSNREVGDHLRSALEDLLIQYRVDLTVSGHVHSYYRTCAAADEACVKQQQQQQQQPQQQQEEAAARPSRRLLGRMPEFVVNASSAAAGKGAADRGPLRVEMPSSSNKDGHGIVHFIIGSAGHELSRLDKGQEEWCAQALQEWGYGRFQVLSDTRMRMEFVASSDGSILDEVEVVASAQRQQMCQQSP